MKAFAVCLVIAVAGVSALPEYYAEFQQLWEQYQQHQLQQQQHHQPQQQQWHQEPQHQPQWHQEPEPEPHWQHQQWQEQQPQQYNAQPSQEYSSDGYKIVPGVVDSRCPRTDDIDHPIHLPVHGNCGKFLKCYGGRAYEQDCPSGLEFGSSVNRCDYPALAKCSSNGW